MTEDLIGRMRILRKQGSTIPIQLSLEEAELLWDALRDVRASIEEWEFHTRLGADVEEAIALERDLASAIDLSKRAT